MKPTHLRKADHRGRSGHKPPAEGRTRPRREASLLKRKGPEPGPGEPHHASSTEEASDRSARTCVFNLPAPTSHQPGPGLPPGELTRSRAEADAQRCIHAAAWRMGLDLGERKSQLLADYLRLLQRWNRVYNLSAIREPDAMLVQHVLDCLAVIPPLLRKLDPACRTSAPTARLGESRVVNPASDAPDLPDHISLQQPGVIRTSGESRGALDLHARPCPDFTKPVRVLDVGSGGGLPGVVLAIVRPDWQVECVDAAAKKASFIRQVASELQVSNLRATHARAESLSPPASHDDTCSGTGYTVVTSRAFASLVDFTRLTHHLLAPDGLWMAMKGRTPSDEIHELPANVQVFHVEQLQVAGLAAKRCLVWMRPLGAR